MQTCVKVEEETSGLDTQTHETKYARGTHTFTFCHDKNQYTVTCDVSMSVLQSLLTNKSFKILYKKKLQAGGKELIIQRQQKPQAAVAPHFPCCLINKEELLNIRFIKSSDGTKPTVTTPDFPVHLTESLVSFYIKTRGEKNIRRAMKNNELWKEVDYVCVCAVKGEKMKEALKRDDRFHNQTLSRGALQDEGTNAIMDLSNLVDSSHGKQFVIIFSPHQTNSQESSQESDKTVKEEQGEVPQETSQEEQSKQGSSSAQEKTPETPQSEQKKRKYPAVESIPGTEEILKLLRRQYGDLLKVLKEREKLKTDADVKRFFREEYDKSAPSFSEVKTVRQLIKFSDYVCQICINGFGRGTGFLLFDQFVLTSCHVVEDLLNLQQVEIKAVFNFEDQTSEKIVKSIKSVVASKKGPDEMGNYLDFALLELECKGKVPEWCFNDPPDGGGVCIIGHPDSGVKQMDPCFILPKKKVGEAGVEHSRQSSNPEVLFNFLTWKWENEGHELHQSQFYLDSCFFHGASGSPMFDSCCNLIGIYTGGYFYIDKGQKRSVVEFGLPINPILIQIYIQCTSNGTSSVVEYMESQKNLNHVAAGSRS